jgi:hypothetical protein
MRNTVAFWGGVALATLLALGMEAARAGEGDPWVRYGTSGLSTIVTCTNPHADSFTPHHSVTSLYALTKDHQFACVEANASNARNQRLVAGGTISYYGKLSPTYQQSVDYGASSTTTITWIQVLCSEGATGTVCANWEPPQPCPEGDYSAGEFGAGSMPSGSACFDGCTYTRDPSVMAIQLDGGTWWGGGTSTGASCETSDTQGCPVGWHEGGGQYGCTYCPESSGYTWTGSTCLAPSGKEVADPVRELENEQAEAEREALKDDIRQLADQIDDLISNYDPSGDATDLSPVLEALARIAGQLARLGELSDDRRIVEGLGRIEDALHGDGTGGMAETLREIRDLLADEGEEGEPGGGDLPGIGSFWDAKYPGGFGDVWAIHEAALHQTAVMQWLGGWSFAGGGGGCPSWSFDLWGIAGSWELTPPCWLWDVVGLIMIITALLTARRLVFGG